MGEFAFELRLCAHLEASGEYLLARQLGGGVETAGRVLDIVAIEPGERFDERTALTAEAIPSAVLEADLGVGRFRDWRRTLGDGLAARHAVERAHAIGYLERSRDGGRELVRPVSRYPDGWFDRIIAIENKPDLGAPGDLYEQLEFDVALGLVDAVVLATASHITRAHRNRLPDAVGLWRYDPTTDELEVHREPTALPVDRPGLEIVDRRPGRTDVTPIEPATKRRARRRLAERAYGKGWRTYTLPACRQLDPTETAPPGLPWCAHFERLVNPGAECSSDCPGHRTGPPPPVAFDAIRDERSPWVADPPDRRSQQAHLDDWLA